MNQIKNRADVESLKENRNLFWTCGTQAPRKQENIGLGPFQEGFA